MNNLPAVRFLEGTPEHKRVDAKDFILKGIARDGGEGEPRTADLSVLSENFLSDLAFAGMFLQVVYSRIPSLSGRNVEDSVYASSIPRRIGQSTYRSRFQVSNALYIARYSVPHE